MKNIICGVLFVIFTLSMSGCVIGKTSPVVRTFVDTNVPLQDHSMLNIDHSVTNVSVNGKFSLSASGLTSQLGEKNPIVILTPGVHTIIAFYTDITSGNSDSYTVSSAGPFTLKYEFMPGHFYHLYPVIDGRIVSLEITDETDPFIFRYSSYRFEARQRIEKTKKKVGLQ